MHVPVVDPLEDHRELEAGQRLVEAEVTEVAAGARRIPLHDVLATREAGRPRGGGDAGSDTERGDALVGEQERDVGQRVAEGRHLPVDHRADRVIGRDEDVVEPVVAVDHGARPVGGDAVAQPGPQLGDPRDLAAVRRVQLLAPAAHLAGEEALRPAEVAQPDCGGIDEMQVGEGVDEALADLAGSLLSQRLQLGLGPVRHAVDQRHHVERRTDHRLVGTPRIRLRHGDRGVLEAPR